MMRPTTQVRVETSMEAAILAGVLGTELYSRADGAFNGVAVNRAVDAHMRGDGFLVVVEEEVDSYDAIGDLLDVMLVLARWHVPVTVDVPMSRELLAEAVFGAAEEPHEYINPRLPADVMADLERASLILGEHIRDEKFPGPGMCIWCDAHGAEWVNQAGDVVCEDCARQQAARERGERIAAGLALAQAVYGLHSAGLTQPEIRAAVNDALRGPHSITAEVPVSNPPVLSSPELPESDWWQIGFQRVQKEGTRDGDRR